MNNDPIADLLTRIRNASKVGLATTDIPASKLKIELVKLLQNEGYLQSYELREDPNTKHQTLRVHLKYNKEGYPVIRLIKRVSRPGLRKYYGVDNIPRIIAGAGVAVMSTNKGLLSDREARKQRVGGELLCVVR